MENPENNHQQLDEKDSDIDKDIDKQIKAVYDELKSYIDDLVCCDKFHHKILIREARFEYAMSELKFLVWRKQHNITITKETN